MTPMQSVQYEKIVNKSFTEFLDRSLTQGSRARNAGSFWMRSVKDRR